MLLLIGRDRSRYRSPGWGKEACPILSSRPAFTAERSTKKCSASGSLRYWPVGPRGPSASHAIMNAEGHMSFSLDEHLGGPWIEFGRSLDGTIMDIANKDRDIFRAVPVETGMRLIALRREFIDAVEAELGGAEHLMDNYLPCSKGAQRRSKEANGRSTIPATD